MIFPFKTKMNIPTWIIILIVFWIGMKFGLSLSSFANTLIEAFIGDVDDEEEETKKQPPAGLYV